MSVINNKELAAYHRCSTEGKPNKNSITVTSKVSYQGDVNMPFWPRIKSRTHDDMSWQGNTFHITAPSWNVLTGNRRIPPHKRASNVESWQWRNHYEKTMRIWNNIRMILNIWWDVVHDKMFYNGHIFHVWHGLRMIKWQLFNRMCILIFRLQEPVKELTCRFDLI